MIPEKLKVTFPRRDVVAEGLALLESRYVKACIFRQFVAALLAEVQELSDALIDLQRKRTLYEAEGEILDGLGRIVGEDRTPYQYSDEMWFAFDRSGQTFDAMPFWCIGAPLASYLPVEDSQFQHNILLRILKNHTLIASPFELNYQSEFASGQPVSFEKTGPMQVRLIVPADFPITDLIRWTTPRDTRFVDDEYAVPYPATLNVSGYVVYVPRKYFAFDRMNEHQFDAGSFAVETNVPIFGD